MAKFNFLIQAETCQEGTFLNFMVMHTKPENEENLFSE